MLRRWAKTRTRGPTPGPSRTSGHLDPEEPTLRPWRDHLEPDDPVALDPAPRAPGLGAAGTLLHRWAARWATAPDAPLWCEGGRWWSAGEFDAATRRAAGRLRTAGLVPGDRLVWSVPSSVGGLAAHVGALRAGLVVVPANTAYTEPELAHIVGDVRAAGAVVGRTDQAAWVRSAAPGAVVVGPGLDLPDGDPGPLDQAAPDAPALICFTSGTTGAPKGAVLRHRNLLAATESVVRAWRMTPDDRLVHCLPVFHAHGLAVGAYGTMTAGGSAVLLPGFNPGAVADTVRSARASLFFGVPTMYHRLVASGRAADLSRLRLCVSGSAPLPAGLHAAASAAIGSTVLERYGMTETLMNTSNPYVGDRRAGTVGFPLPGVEVRLDAAGEVLLRGPNVFDGYFEREAATAEAFRDLGDGGGTWFVTGDLGEDVDGYLVIRGRSKELIISGGFNVYPTEVEDVLVRCPGVAEVAVTGTPSDEWGEVVTAWVVPDGTPPTVESLRAHCDGRLASYKQPRVVRVVDALPRNALGKVVRSTLR
jgi:malonyl-CoA/methylmalonyl-CoA synthetase